MNKDVIIQTIIDLYAKNEQLLKENIELKNNYEILQDKVKRLTSADKTKKTTIIELQTKLQEKEKELNMLRTIKKINEIKSKK